MAMSALTRRAASTPTGFPLEVVTNLLQFFRLRPTDALCAAALGVALLVPGAALASSPDTVMLEALTWTDVQARVASGTETVLIPVGGTEQNGPHMALGKHNVRVYLLAEMIAKRIGGALVAPVMAYVPEGQISPPTGHMRYSGTISISGKTFESLLEDSANSFQQHGFRRIVLLGDHGGYQNHLAQVAARLNQRWAGKSPARVLHLKTFYDSAVAPFNQTLREKGFAGAEIGLHAGLADTSLSMALAPNLVDASRLAQAAIGARTLGVDGDPRRATAALGQAGVRLIVDNSVEALQKWIGKP